MTKIVRASALTARHIDLGGKTGEYIRMGVPMKYSTNPKDEHDAVREVAGMYDFTAFLKYTVKGPDATKVINHTVTFDVTKLKPGQSKYGPFLRENGTICDDGITFRLSENEYMVVHGDGCALRMAEASALDKDVDVEYDGGTHLISMQGPKALEILDPHTPIDLKKMNYFHHQKTELFGHPCLLSRTGFSGERGYEVFISPQLAVSVWDNMLHYGRDMGVMPCSMNSVFPLRMEAGLGWRRFDLMEHTPWEVRMGYAVDLNKDDFRGKDALVAAKGKERYFLVGLVADIDHALSGGEKLLINNEEVGEVNGNPSYSHRLKKSIAFARLNPDVAKVGTVVEVKGEDMSCSATVVRFPVYDPKKTRTHEVN
jgi:aminomethyltransferase